MGRASTHLHPYHQMIRQSQTDKLYWLGNICTARRTEIRRGIRW